MKLSLKAWQKLISREDFKDLSNELPNEFLMVGQWMRAKICVAGETYYVIGWKPPGGRPFVNLTPTQDSKSLTSQSVSS